MAGKKEVNNNFRCDDEFAEWLGKQVFEIDCSKSDLIRCCCLLSVPLVRANPSLLRMVTLEQFKSAKSA